MSIYQYGAWRPEIAATHRRSRQALEWMNELVFDFTQVLGSILRVFGSRIPVEGSYIPRTS